MCVFLVCFPNSSSIQHHVLTSPSIFLNSGSSSSTSKYSSVDVTDIIPGATIPGAINLPFVLMFTGPDDKKKETVRLSRANNNNGEVVDHHIDHWRRIRHHVEMGNEFLRLSK